MERLEELFLKLSGKEEIEYNTSFGRWWRGAEEFGVIEEDKETHKYWGTLLVRELARDQLEEIKTGKPISEAVPTGSIKSLKFATGIATRDGTDIVNTTTKLTHYSTETVNERVNNAIRLQEILGTFLKDNVEKIITYLDPGFPMSSSRTVITIDGEHFSLIYTPSKKNKVKCHKYLQEDAWYGEGSHFVASAREISDVSSILQPLNYHREKLTEAMK